MSQGQTTATTRSPEVLVYMEVVNPTGGDLRLSRLEYRLSADSWFSTQGSVRLARAVAPSSSAVIEIGVPVKHFARGNRAPGINYQLHGRLFARANHVERSWKVAAAGEIKTRTARFRFPVKVDVADAE